MQGTPIDEFLKEKSTLFIEQFASLVKQASTGNMKTTKTTNEPRNVRRITYFFRGGFLR